MSAVLLDTTIASLLHPKKKHHTLRAQYESHLRGQILALSFQTVAELLGWAEENNWGVNQRAGLEVFLQQFLVISYNFDMAKIWAKVTTHCKQAGRLEAGDAWIAAIAVRYQIPLLTHDRDLVGLSYPGLHVISYV
jgi:predicted nucleic acid-binding protein